MALRCLAIAFCTSVWPSHVTFSSHGVTAYIFFGHGSKPSPGAKNASMAATASSAVFGSFCFQSGAVFGNVSWKIVGTVANSTRFQNLARRSRFVVTAAVVITKVSPAPDQR